MYYDIPVNQATKLAQTKRLLAEKSSQVHERIEFKKNRLGENIALETTLRFTVILYLEGEVCNRQTYVPYLTPRKT